MKKVITFVMCCATVCVAIAGRNPKSSRPLFKADLSNAQYDPKVWSVDGNGVLSASGDDAIWTSGEYENFELTLDFNNETGTNR